MNDEHMNEKWFKEYQRLGGNQKFDIYKSIRDKFQEFTSNAFIGGCEDGPYVDLNRKQSLSLFRKWLKENHPTEKVNMIFQSVDNITPYT